MTYDRAAIMRDAHKRFRDGKRLGLGWTFGQCLSTAWRAAKARRKASMRHCTRRRSTAEIVADQIAKLAN